MGRFGSQFAVFAVLTVLYIAAFAQQNPPAGGTATDAFRGRWKLNVNKSSQGPTAEMITIEPEGKRYRITREAVYRDGSESSVWTVTDMKGWPSTVTQKDGAATHEEWRVKRDGADSFVVAAVFHGGASRIESRYTVSPDGRTLTRRMISGGPPNFRNHVLVFDKVP